MDTVTRAFQQPEMHTHPRTRARALGLTLVRTGSVARRRLSLGSIA